MLILGKLAQAWRAPQTLSRLEASSSLHPNTILDNLGMRNLQGRQTWSFSSPLELGGAPGLKSNCSQEASPLLFYDALEEVLPREQELSQEAPHIAQLRAELVSLRIDVEHLVLLIQSDSLNKGDNNILELRTRSGPSQLDECVRERACRDKLAKATCSLDADNKKGEHNRVDFLGQQQQQEQKNKQSNSLQDEAAKQRVACIARSAAYPAKWCKICWKTSHATQACWYNNQQPQQHHKAKAWKQTTRVQQQPAEASEQQLQQQACNNSLGIGEQQPMGSLEQQPLACRSPRQTLGQAWSILIDTGAELSVAPRSFADHIQLSSPEEALELRAATGKAVTTFDIRTAQLLSQGVSFEMSFVIADVEQPLLGVSSLIHAKLSLHIGNLGHHLVKTTGEKIQLEQRGQQIYLVACPIELGLTHCMIGNLLDSSFLPEDKSLVPKVASEEGAPDEGGATSFSLESFEQQQQDRNKTALGTALPKQVARKQACKNTACKIGTKKKPSAHATSQQHSLRKQKQKGQQEAVGKLRFFEEVELALLTPEDPSSLQENASKDLSLRILLTLSLMHRWQLKTTRLTASPQQAELTRQLRNLVLRTSEVDNKIFVGDQLCVMIHENTMMIGGEKLQQECFIDKLSACLPLHDTHQLDDKTPLSFLGRTLEYNQAENTISLHLDPAFFLQLIRRYGLEDAASRSTPREELRPKAPSKNNKSLDAERTKLYRQTVGQLQWSSLLRPDIGFAVQQLSNSFRTPTEHDEQQLVNLLKYLRGTLQYSISLQPPRRWQKATSLELLAFASTSWSEAGRPTSGLSLFFMGVPLVASTMNQATTRTAAQFASMRMACAIAIQTKSLLQDLVIEQPFSLRALAGGALAMQLGLTRRSRHIQLRSRFGQFQLSKVGPKQNLAAPLANNSTASGLHRLLSKLKMHARAADTLALSTGRGEETAFFRSSSGSFFIGVLRKASAMSQLLSAEELLGKEDVKPNNLPELAAAHATDLSLQHQSLQREELATDYATQLRVQNQSLQEEEFVATYSTQLSSELQILQRKELEAAPCKERTSLHQKELAWLAYLQDSSTRACQDQLDASQKSPLHRPRVSHSFMLPGLISKKELSGKALVDHLAYPKLAGKETEENIFLPNSLGEKSLSLRKRSLERKNFCILLIELMLAFFAVLGMVSFQTHSLQQDELAAAYSQDSFQTHSLQQDELVAAYSTDSFQTQSLQQDEFVAAYVTEISFHNQSLQQEQLVAASLAQNKSLQQNELVDHLAQLCYTEPSVQSFQLILAQLCEEQLSNKSFQLSTQQLCKQDSANKSFQLTSAQLCRSSSADRAYSNKSLHQLTLSLAQSVPPEQLCSQQNANQSFQLLTAQLCFKAQFNSAWIKDLQNLASTKAVADRRASHRRAFQITSLAAAALDRTALQRGAFQQVCSAEIASDTACFTTRALQQTGATAAFTTRAAAPATASYIASSQQTASATSLFAQRLVNKSFLAKQKLRTTQPHKGEHIAFPTRPSESFDNKNLDKSFDNKNLAKSFDNKSFAKSFDNNNSFTNRSFTNNNLDNNQSLVNKRFANKSFANKSLAHNIDDNKRRSVANLAFQLQVYLHDGHLHQQQLPA